MADTNMQLYNVIEFKKGLLISAETFQEKQDAVDHYRGVGRITTPDTVQINHGTFTVLGDAHIVHFIVTTL